MGTKSESRCCCTCKWYEPPSISWGSGWCHLMFVIGTESSIWRRDRRPSDSCEHWVEKEGEEVEMDGGR